MRGAFDLRIGRHFHLTGQGRLTPANIVAGGLMTAAILAAAAGFGTGRASLKGPCEGIECPVFAVAAVRIAAVFAIALRRR
jgi:hypothetical protein